MNYTAQLTVVEADNAGIPVPDDVIADLGGGNHPKVTVTINGFSFRTSAAKMAGSFWLPVNKARRAEGGLEVGVPYDIEIALDTSPRTVDMPEELATWFDDQPGAKAAWEALSYSEQLRLVTPALNAKTAATRVRNIEKIMARLSAES